jgi:cytochrome-b5 reductase
LRQELEEYAKNFPDRLSIWFTIDKSVLSDWKYDIGFVNRDMLEKHMPAPGDDTLILMCGPPPMINFACVPNLEQLGYTAEMRFAY